MTRIVRVEELDGDLMVRLPKDLAQQLVLTAGDDIRLTVEPVDERVRRQLELGRKIIDENHAVLAALAK